MWCRNFWMGRCNDSGNGSILSQLGLNATHSSLNRRKLCSNCPLSWKILTPRTTDTQWRHKSKKSENLGRWGRQNMLRLYLKILEWGWIFGRAGKVISSPAVSSRGIYYPLCKLIMIYCLNIRVTSIFTLHTIRFHEFWFQSLQKNLENSQVNRFWNRRYTVNNHSPL